MKKTVAILLSAVLLLLCSCGSKNDVTETNTTEAEIYKSADMLNITNFGTDFSDCLSRYNAVLSAVKNKVQILENEHNKAIKAENPEEYFLNENYILTFFDPFLLNSFFLAEKFDTRMSESQAKELFAPHSNGGNISYESKSDGTITLSFSSEENIKKYSIEYSENSDSFRFIASTDSHGRETVDEILEFVKYSEYVYIIQSATTRCYVEFDSDGKIVYMCCSTLKNNVYSQSERIYNSNIEVDRKWASSKSISDYLSIHTYSNGVLTHKECSSGPWKTVAINENDYASAFIF